MFNILSINEKNLHESMSKLIYKFLIITLFFLKTSMVLAKNENETYVMGFGSCITEKREQPIWEAIKNENIDEFFFMGDNVYGDTEDGLLDGMRASYDKQKKMFPKWLFEKKLNAIWDDHDYGKNDGGSEYPLKEEAQKLFLKFWNVDAEDPRHDREGIYFNEEKQILGSKVNLVTLDTRYHRSLLGQEGKPYSPIEDTSKTMLGEEQWSWLENILKKESDLIIIVSSIQVLPTNHVFEKWHNFPHERQRLLELLESTNKSVVILSGDRHKAGLYEKGKITEMTSSSMNKPISRYLVRIWNLLNKESDELLKGEMYTQENYGVLSFKKGRIEIFLKNLEGETIIYKKI